jgi:hypothetical protein
MHPPSPPGTADPGPPAPLAAALAGRYRVQRPLGAGGMATVYLATDVRHDRQVALKVLRPELAAVLGAQRFLNEVRITARLEHPHIVTLIDSGESNGFLWYVLPYIRGESLRDRLVRERQLGVDESLAITRQVAAALEYAHRQGVVHRDIKPENILLHEGEAMLADFGIALAVKEAGGNRLTETGLSLGTPQYMSPEQATGDRGLDARSDVYSLAAVLYEMLAGEPPHTGPTVQAVIAKLMTERPTRLRTVRDSVPEGVDVAVAKALAKVPADRYASAGEFSGALVAGAAPEERGARGHAAARRWRNVVIGAGLAALAAALAVTIVRRPAPPAIVQPERVQVTFTGNARFPSLSADGRRVAYSTRKCTDDGRCTEDLVVQDVGGAGSATVLSGWAGIWTTQWTSDGRYLLVEGWPALDRKRGMFGVPSLGGEPRDLGCCQGALVVGGDTVLMNSGAPGDSVVKLTWVSVSDGTVYDSLITPAPAGAAWAWSLAEGGLLAVVRGSARGVSIVVMDRSGRALDSVPLDARRWNGLNVRGESRKFLLAMQRANEGGGSSDLIAYDVSDNGRIKPKPDTLLRQFDSEAWSLSRGGLLAYAYGPVSYDVWMFRREAAGSLRFTQQRLGGGTALTHASINPQGNMIAIRRDVMLGGRRLRQISVLPADGGAERTLGPPADIVGGRWTPTGQAYVALVRKAEDSVEVRDMNVTTGRTTSIATVPRDAAAGVIPLPGGGFVAVNTSRDTLRLMRVPGRRDTTLALSERWMRFGAAASSPDGRDIAFVWWDQSSDSILVHRLALADGRLTRLAAFAADFYGSPGWLRDGTITVPVTESGGTSVWYSVPASGGAPVRLGIPPRTADYFSFSDDGRRVVATVVETRPDVYLIRNFPDLLRLR